MPIPNLRLNQYTRLNKQSASALKIFHKDPSNIVLHKHDFYEIVVVFKGEGKHIMGCDERPVFPNAVIVVPPNCKHCFTDFQKLTLLNFMFSNELLQDFISKVPGLATIEGFQKMFSSDDLNEGFFCFTDDRTMAQLEELVSRIMHEQQDGNASFHPMIVALLLEAVILLTRNILNIPIARAADMQRLTSLISYLEKNYQKEIKLHDMAALVHMSISNFSRIFKRCMGLSPFQYVLSLRLKRAEELLLHSQYSISEIANLCGFQDSNYFSRRFTAQFSCSPKKYRQQNHGLMHVPGEKGEKILDNVSV